ncbi:MAG: hypothetical protein KIS87_06980 [Phycisphaeraceae bacterium]|nr:hypothetical protein [Phycisphaeraceae bacterium]
MARPPLDDRGVPYEPVALAELALRADSQADRDSARRLQGQLKRARHEITPRWTSRRILATMPIAAFIALVCIPTFLWLFGGSRGSVLLAVSALAVLAHKWFERRLKVERLHHGVGATIVAHGFCARCAYSLKGLEAMPDGTIVCPECGAAWIAARITRPHWTGMHPPLAEAPPHLPRLLFIPPPLVNDARGVLVRRMDSWLLSVRPDRRQAMGRERVQRLRRALRKRGRWLRWPLAAFPAVTSIWLLAQFTHLDGVDEQWRVLIAAGIVIPALLLACSSLVALLGEFGIPLSHFARTAEAEGVCAACAGELAPADAAGYRVCITCGATWRAPTEPEQRTHPPA